VLAATITLYVKHVSVDDVAAQGISEVSYEDHSDHTSTVSAFHRQAFASALLPEAPICKSHGDQVHADYPDSD
jgi:hypothetical protein